MWSPIKQVLWYLLAGSRGGITRSIILKEITYQPANANQLAKKLKLDYKTIQYHLKIMCDNNLIAPHNKGTYGAVYFPTHELEMNMLELEKIWDKL